MVPPIIIDTMGLSQEFDLTQEDVDNMKRAVVQTVTTAIHSAWMDEAKHQLGSTRDQYINSIIVVDKGPFENLLTLVGTLPNMIEQGQDPYDMKEGFARSNKKKITKDKDGKIGWYLTIPFTWASPGALGESSQFTGVLPKDISSLLKKKQKTHGQQASLSLKDMPSEFQIPKTRPSMLLDNKLVPEYKNKNSIYEGLSQKSKGGKVMSFRRVSSNSDDNSWMHRGLKAANLAEKAVENTDIGEIVGDVIDMYLDNILG